MNLPIVIVTAIALLAGNNVLSQSPSPGSSSSAPLSQVTTTAIPFVPPQCPEDVNKITCHNNNTCLRASPGRNTFCNSTRALCCFMPDNMINGVSADLQKCSSIDIIVNTSLSNCSALLHTLTYKELNVSVFCFNFWDEVMKCVARTLQSSIPQNPDPCIMGIKNAIKQNPGAVFEKLAQRNVTLGNPQLMPTDCQQFWDEACPAPESQGSSNCQGSCNSNSDCLTSKKETCCRPPGSCGKCLPDLTQCANAEAIVNITKANTNCLKFFKTIDGKTYQSYCRSFWQGLSCSLKELVGETYSKLCLERVARLIQLNSMIIVDKLKQEGITTAIKQDFALSTAQCKENPLAVISVQPVANNAVRCADADTIMANANNTCKSVTSDVMSNAVCKQFSELIDCIATNIYPANSDSFLRKQCASTILNFVKDNSKQLYGLFPDSLQFDPAACEARLTICGNGREPSDTYQCVGKLCPKDYQCKKGFCCPQERNGTCPTPVGIVMCLKTCANDSQCETDEKCCNLQGCGGPTCAKLVTKEKTRCEKEFDVAKKKMELVGACSDGNSFLAFPRCQNGRYHPIQGDLQNGQLYCVYENGTKIPESDFTGNKDCTKDVLPAQPNDSCPSRSCCPITLCQDQVCQADVTAVCRINSCGGCKVEFFNALGKIMDCGANVSLCQRKFNEAHRANAQKVKTDDQRLVSFLNAYSKMYGQSNAQGAINTMNSMNKIMMDDGTTGDVNFVVTVVDEYGDMALNFDELPEDDMDRKGSENKTEVALFLCGLMHKYGICKNGGTCNLMTDEKWQFCVCKSGFGGPFCENNNTATNDTRCNNASNNIAKIYEYLKKPNQLETMMLYQLTALFNILPISISCTDGKFTEVQVGKLLPIKSDRGNIIYCVNTTTGMRKPNSAVVSQISPEVTRDINCSVTYPVDILALPKRCMLPRNAACADSSSCQYFYNPTTQMCDAGAPDNGFDSLTDCYDTCVSLMNKCQTCSVELDPCMNLKCNYSQQFCDIRSMNGAIVGVCTYFPEYCLENVDKGYGDKNIAAYYFHAASRKCKKFNYTGDGGNKNRFYNLHQCHTECSTRKYKYVVPVCPIPRALVIATADFDMCYDDTTCPNNQVCCSNGIVRVCTDSVSSCSTGQRCSLFGVCDGATCVCPDCSSSSNSPVCGSDGKIYGSLCLLTRQACLTMMNITLVDMERCGKVCDGKQCAANEICNGTICSCEIECTMDFNPICGQAPDTGVLRTFSNPCNMKQIACLDKVNYRQLFVGPCDPTGEKTCLVPCTREYRPLCVLDKSSSSGVPVTYNNPCLMKADMLCGKKTLQILSDGPCTSMCNDTLCGMYKSCINNQCMCSLVCTLEYMPVCGYPESSHDNMTTFNNLCEMRYRACISNQRYILEMHGPCTKTEPVFKCPVLPADIPFSAEISCNNVTNAFCDNMTEMCCQYGAGTRCISRQSLIRQEIMKAGVCRTLSLLDYDSSRCIPDKCTSDLDCAGADKCCMNQVCGHGTCAELAVKPGPSDVCTTFGAQYRLMPGLQCDPSNSGIGCPSTAKCISYNQTQSLLDNVNLTLGVCCQPDSVAMNATDNANAVVCFLLNQVGVVCQNGGTCVGDLINGNVCACLNGSYGVFCEIKVLGTCSTPGNCSTDLCTSSTCPAYPLANCTVKYCGGNCSAVWQTDAQVDVTKLCYETPCLKRKVISKKIFETIFRDIDNGTMAGVPGNQSLSKPFSCPPQINGMAGPYMCAPLCASDSTCPGNQKCCLHGCGNKCVDPVYPGRDIFKEQFSNVLLMMSISSVPLRGEVSCTPNGNFEQVQCFMAVPDGKRSCACVDQSSGLQINNGPEVEPDKNATLNCSFASQDGLPRFCLDVPNMISTCGEVETQRYFFNPATQQCENYTETGCNYNVQNNFNSYYTCQSICGVGDTRCAILQCLPSQECRIKDDTPYCMDINTPPATLEPQCESDGSFKLKQCSRDLCVCVNASTGEAIPNSIAEGFNLRCDLSRVCKNHWLVNENITVNWTTYPEINIAEFVIHLSANVLWMDNQWLGLGFSRDQKMLHSDVYTIETVNATTRIFNRYAVAYDRPPADTNQNMTVNITQENGMTIFQFWRPIISNSSSDNSLNESMYLLLAYGAANASGIYKHSYKIPSANKYNFASNCDGPYVLPRKLAEPKKCPNKLPMVFCDNGGDPCKNCTVPTLPNPNQSQGTPTVDANGTCPVCQKCSANSSATKCQPQCNSSSVCKHFPSAICRINKCTCAEEFLAGNKLVNCNAVQSQCERWKFDVNTQQKSQALTNSVPSNNVQVRCSGTGSFEAKCLGNQCYCLNASSGEIVGNAQTLTDIMYINCNETQKKTKPVRVNVTMIVAKNKRLSDFNDTQQNTIIKEVSQAFSSKIKAIAITTLRDGSVLADTSVASDPNSPVVTETSDLMSQVQAVLVDLNSGALSVNVGDVVLIVSGASVTAVVTEQGEVITNPPPPDNTDNDRAVRIGVGIGIGVGVPVLIAFIVGIYCCKQQRHSKNRNIQFTELQGRENAAYGRS